jgi:hypothetical protein
MASTDSGAAAAVTRRTLLWLPPVVAAAAVAVTAAPANANTVPTHSLGRGSAAGSVECAADLVGR